MSSHDIPGYSGFLWCYDEAVNKFRPDPPTKAVCFVEVGVALGHSIAYLAEKVVEKCQLEGFRPNESYALYAVDPWGGYARNGEQQSMLGTSTTGDFNLYCEYMLKHAPVPFELIRPIRAKSAPAALMFPDDVVDMVLIDGAHDAENVRIDIEAWWPKVRSGGWLCGDDFEPNYPGVEKAVRAWYGPRKDASELEIRGTTWRVVKK